MGCLGNQGGVLMKRIMFLFLLTILAGGESGNKGTFSGVGVSMAPTIEDNQKVVVDKDFYKINEIKRDDLVLYKLSEAEEKLSIKRVIGLPNDLLQVKDGTFYINNEPLVSEYTFHIPDLEISIKLMDNEYFVIGDNHRYSRDSRHIGPILKEDILGKVVEIK